jgi:phosphoenolpyruvate carboxykinase (ATP)
MLLKRSESYAREFLTEESVRRGEGVLSAQGVLTVTTGKRTGRSPRDRYIVRDAITDQTVAWGNVNQPFAQDDFQALWDRALAYVQDKDYFVQHLRVGEDQTLGIKVKVVTEWAWHALFCKDMFIEGDGTWSEKDWMLLSAPELVLDPASDSTNGDGAVILNMTARKVLLCGMRYAGEIKKAMFSVLNFMLPVEDVLPMHCAANMNERGDSALFFGLSGTGKTTLSADPGRFLIGDDEHGWGPQGIFNFEGGCYAKCIHLSREAEPVIYDAIKPGAVMENVHLDENGVPDFSDDRYTQNTRAAYPRTHVPLRVDSNQAGHPSAVIFLACDLYGVLPAVSVLSLSQASYYFLSGYTALVGSTEVGAEAGVNPTFSTCFGAPFFPRASIVYANLLEKRLVETGAKVYLVNTGWYGGQYGKGGERFPIKVTRAVVQAITEGKLSENQMEVLPGFELAMPWSIKGIDEKYLHPLHAWPSTDEYWQSAKTLIDLFQKNAKKTMSDVSASILAAGPALKS